MVVQIYSPLFFVQYLRKNFSIIFFAAPTFLLCKYPHPERPPFLASKSVVQSLTMCCNMS